MWEVNEFRKHNDDTAWAPLVVQPYKTFTIVYGLDTVFGVRNVSLHTLSDLWRVRRSQSVSGLFVVLFDMHQRSIMVFNICESGIRKWPQIRGSNHLSCAGAFYWIIQGERDENTEGHAMGSKPTLKSSVLVISPWNGKHYYLFSITLIIIFP